MSKNRILEDNNYRRVELFGKEDSKGLILSDLTPNLLVRPHAE